MFKLCAKKYGGLHLRKDKTTQPPHYIVIFKRQDADNLEQVFREFTRPKRSPRKAAPSIRKVLAVAAERPSSQNAPKKKPKRELKR